MKLEKIVLLIIALLCGSAFAQLEKPVQQAILGVRRPAISADGAKVAFVYHGDIWIASTSGGRAVRLTDNIEQDTLPLFSPDGKWIVFTSMRTGNYDIFVVPSIGGTPRQITFSSNYEMAYDWSPDGRFILFNGMREEPGWALFETDVKSLQFHKRGTDYKGIGYPSYSPDGKQAVYCRKGFPWYRPRYRGSGATEMWTMDLATGKRHQITGANCQYLWPKFMPNGETILCVATGQATPSSRSMTAAPVKFTDNPDRTPNLWLFNQRGKGKRLTSFVGEAVRFPSVARKTGDVVFEYGDGIWLLKKGEDKPKKITLYASLDNKVNDTRRETYTGGANEAEISPDGTTVAFCVHDDIWTVPVEKPKKSHNPDDATRLTDYVGYDGDICWSKDGKKLYFVSDREGPLSLFEMDVASKQIKRLVKREVDIFQLRLSPDGKQLVFWIMDHGLYMMPVESGEPTMLVDYPGVGGWAINSFEYSFSPDMQWLAYSMSKDGSPTDLRIKPVKGGEAINVTKLNAANSQIAWSPDGKYLFFTSDRNGSGAYVLPLQKEDALAEDVEMKFEAPKDVKFNIDFNNTERRIRKLTWISSEGDITIGSDGTFYFLNGGNVCSATYDWKTVTPLMGGGGVQSMSLMQDGKRIFMLRWGSPQILTLGPNSISPVTFSANWEVDRQTERHAAFSQFWRTFNRSFYDPNFHGRDWAELRKHYEPLIDTVGTNREFCDLLSMMVGELDASHTEFTPTGNSPSSPATPMLGFFFDYSYAGPGIRIREVPDGAPGSFAKTKLNAGEYVMAINDKDVRLDEYLFKTLNNYWGKDLELLVNKTPEKKGARTVIYRALGTGANDFDYNEREPKLREMVDKKSAGRIGYAAVPMMMPENLEEFQHEFYEYSYGKDAVIIDFRWDGGGMVGDTLTNWLTTKPLSFTTVRRSKPSNVPGNSFDKPMVVLINEWTMSNAEIVAYNLKQSGATLVGMPTPGYVIWTGNSRLVDGTGIRIPGIGAYRRDGSNMEDNGQKPDIMVDIPSTDWEANRDPQLDVAIDVLMKKIKK